MEFYTSLDTGTRRRVRQYCSRFTHNTGSIITIITIVTALTSTFMKQFLIFSSVMDITDHTFIESSQLSCVSQSMLLTTSTLYSCTALQAGRSWV